MSAIPAGIGRSVGLPGSTRDFYFPTDMRLILMNFLPLDILQALASLCRRTIGSR